MPERLAALALSGNGVFVVRPSDGVCGEDDGCDALEDFELSGSAVLAASVSGLGVCGFAVCGLGVCGEAGFPDRLAVLALSGGEALVAGPRGGVCGRVGFDEALVEAGLAGSAVLAAWVSGLADCGDAVLDGVAEDAALSGKVVLTACASVDVL